MTPAPSGFTTSIIGSTSFFQGLLASPPPIGSTTPNSGAFTTLTTTGNVGIGTAAPGALLTVNGSFYASGVSSFANATTNFGAVSAASGPNLYLINTNGGAGAGASLVFLNNNSSAAQKTAAYINGGLVVSTAGAEQGLIDFEVFDGTNNTNRIIGMQVNASGASGTFAPNTDNYWNLGVSGYRWANIYAATAASTTGFALTADYTYFTPSGLSAIPNYGLGAPGSNNVAVSAYSNLTFYTGQAERVRITATGNVGIGTTSPGYKLQILANSNTNDGLYISNTSTGASAQAFLNVAAQSWTGVQLTQNQASGNISIYTGDNVPLAFSTNAAERMRITSTGNVGIGTSSPGTGTILDVQSTTAGVRFPNMTTTQKTAITPAAGTVVFDTTLAKLCLYTGAAWQTITSV